MTLSGSDIADTIKAVQDYVRATKQAHPILLDTFAQEAVSWLGDLQSLRNGGDQAIDAFFRPSAPNKELGDNLLIANLRSYARILQFDAYRERLNGNDSSQAQQLLGRMESFRHKLYDNDIDKGFTEFGVQVSDYIKGTPRHPSEVYLEPLDLKVDCSSAIADVYDLYANWFPSDDMQTVTGAFPVYADNEEYKSYDIACKKEQLAWAFEREGLPAKVEVKLGKPMAKMRSA